MGSSQVKIRGLRRIFISGDYIKLDALLKYASIVSTGGEAKAVIQMGRVFVGGEACKTRGKKIRHGDVVRFGSEVLIVRRAAQASGNDGL